MNAVRKLTIVLFALAIASSLEAQNPAKRESFKPSEEAQAIIDATNKEREMMKLPPLKANEKLFKAAQAHSENMAKHNTRVQVLDGKNPHVLDGKNPEDRVRATGYAFVFIGENLAWNQRNPEELLKEWMASEQHRTNILDKRFREIGIGIAKNDKGEPYYTQVFGTPRGR